MSVTADAIAKIKANKQLRSKRFSKFKRASLFVAKKGSAYNEAYLNSKFSLSRKEAISSKIALEKRNQKILNWTFWFLILTSLFSLFILVFY